MSARRAWCCLLFMLPLLVPAPGWAHKASDSYLSLRLEDAQISGRWDIALRDLDYAIGLDRNGDGAITWGEVRAAQPGIQAYALSALTLRSDEQACRLQLQTLQIVAHSDGQYVALRLAGHCPQPPQMLQIRYRLLFDLDALHRGLLKLDWQGARSGIFSPDHQQLQFERGGSDAWRSFAQYFREGLFHVWSGYDHMLFLAGLFLPAVLRRKRGGWEVEPQLRPALLATARIVTAFTLAHALTLWLAASGQLSLPSRWVETAVAATVAFAGINNVWPLVHRGLFWLAALFGLIHGAAIASALLDLGLPTVGRVTALLAFNLGVEAAQLSLVALIVPLTYRVRYSRIYRRWVLIPLSLAVTLIGLLWMLDRALQLRFMPF